MMATWVIAYDVSSNRNRNRVSKRLAARGIRLQKSVFLVDASPSDVSKLVDEIGIHIDPETDRVSAWQLIERWRESQRVSPPQAALLDEPFIVL